ncbi:ribonuclease III domain-containing protein [Oscillatoria sp. CS-180]|uniref:Mini-ribonuclease 3 n=1 Tax=Oscillatoria sp. CS-180 TaxID=3021720 RepID=UPI00232D8CB3|nr:ribonuclease III domain-containing protein [Oscillatoria sp. CS-180]MDB9526246.1 ribonuclease III domain-containing protein [Oscillatoria sp. CS-180]
MTQSSPNEASEALVSSRMLLLQSGTIVLSNNEVRSLSPLALAYVGDAVYELFVRSRCLMPPKQVRRFHQQVVSHVRAEQQAHYLGYLRPHLTDAEADVVRRGRNAAPNRGQRASRQDYQQATAFEALLGYLYLTNAERLMEILNALPLDMNEPQSSSS